MQLKENLRIKRALAQKHGRQRTDTETEPMLNRPMSLVRHTEKSHLHWYKVLFFWAHYSFLHRISHYLHYSGNILLKMKNIFTVASLSLVGLASALVIPSNFVSLQQLKREVQISARDNTCPKYGNLPDLVSDTASVFTTPQGMTAKIVAHGLGFQVCVILLYL